MVSSGFTLHAYQPDRIVTALHVVAGKKTIVVMWQGKTANAIIEKIYKPSDLLKLDNR